MKLAEGVCENADNLCTVCSVPLLWVVIKKYLFWLGRLGTGGGASSLCEVNENKKNIHL